MPCSQTIETAQTVHTTAVSSCTSSVPHAAIKWQIPNGPSPSLQTHCCDQPPELPRTDHSNASGLPDDASDDDWHRGKKIRATKRAARSELSVSRGDWHRRGYAARPDILSTHGLRDEIPRVHCSELTLEQFVERFERPRLPVVITGVMDSWPARQLWLADKLLTSVGEHRFKVGSDDDGYAVRLPLSCFLHYAGHPEHGVIDDSPLYIFDGTFADRTTSRSLLHDYTVPHYFKEDLFQHVGERRRPPYRWLVLGPARSGSSLHIDPLATSAWNALVHGHKRWALFPPGTPKELVTPREEGLEREAVSWFDRVYPRTRLPGWPTAPPLDLIQGPGECVFVPGGWWHAVLNLDLTVAVTQNYCSSTNFEAVWRHTRRSRPKMSVRWLSALRVVRPDLAAVADAGLERADATCSASSSSSSSSSSDGSSGSDSSSSSDSDSNTDKSRKKKQNRGHQRELGAANGDVVTDDRGHGGQQEHTDGGGAQQHEHRPGNGLVGSCQSQQASLGL